MRRSLIILLVALMPLLLFANVLQAYRYSRLEREVRLLEQQQAALIEETTRAILAISVLTSPERVGPLASGELGLERIGTDDIVRLLAGEGR